MKGFVALALCVASATLGIGAHTTAASRTAADARCTARATRALIHQFVVAYGAGRVAAADRLWAPEPRFHWFSASAPGRRLGPAAYERSTLAAYFRARARVHERLRVTQLRAAYDPARKLVDFSGKLVRGADASRPRLLDFKGAADCLSGYPRLIVWSM